VLSWIPLSSIAQFQSLIDTRSDFAVFKHSTRCSVSNMAKNRLERNWAFPQESLQVYYLDVLSYRLLSDHIAENTGIKHESPQIIVWKEGKVVYHASHSAISAVEMAEAI
jgi:bacillithiol system protein YtxJ